MDKLYQKISLKDVEISRINRKTEVVFATVVLITTLTATFFILAANRDTLKYDSSPEEQFGQFIDDFGKVYADEEE
jgi:hypothetical protein